MPSYCQANQTFVLSIPLPRLLAFLAYRTTGVFGLSIHQGNHSRVVVFWAFIDLLLDVLLLFGRIVIGVALLSRIRRKRCHLFVVSGECYKNNLLITMITRDLDTLYVRAWSAAACSPLRRSLRSLHHRQAPPLSISSTWVYIQLGMAFYSA